MEETQLQWHFEAVKVGEDFPFGVKTTYRGWVENEVIEIVKSKLPHDTVEGRLTGLKAIKSTVAWYPVNNPNGRKDGMYILK